MTTQNATNPNPGVAPSAAAPSAPTAEGGSGEDSSFFPEGEADGGEQGVSDDQTLEAPADGGDGGEGSEDNPTDPTGDQPGADDAVEIEHEGQTYKVPKALKDSFLRNSDYTQKTQALARDRKALDNRDRFVREHLADFVTVNSLERSVAAYADVDWDQLQMTQPEVAAAEWRKLTLLKEDLAGAKDNLRQKEAVSSRIQQRDRARLIEEGARVLAKEMPDWPKVATQVFDYAASNFSFSPEELHGITDPRFIKVLRAASEGGQKASTVAKVATIQATQRTKPAANLRPGASTIPKDPNNMTDAQYYDWRKKQIAG